MDLIADEPAKPGDFRQIGEKVRNWGRWGAEDQKGTLNLISPDRLRHAAEMIRRGAVFNLGIPLGPEGPQNGEQRTNPLRLMSEIGQDQPFPGGFKMADDYVVMALQAGTQWDALGHVFYDGQLYNGFPESDVSPHGLKHNSIDQIADGVTGCGVLLDIPRLKEIEWLQAGEVITPGDLDAALARQRVELLPGDIVLVRTGWWSSYLSTGDRQAFNSAEPGIGIACCEWLHEREVAALACDNWGVEPSPGAGAGGGVPGAHGLDP